VVRYLRFVSLLLTSIVVAGVSTLAAAPASASTASPQGASGTAYLCWGYAGCARAGMGNAGYSSVSRTMYWRMYGGHNCTNYAAYRMVHGGLPNTRPWTGSGNATNWGAAMSRITSGTPAVGAVAWWRAYVRPAGSVGHVAYVERVVDANTIIVSQDSWGGDFSWKRITRGGGQWPSGFVHFNDLGQRNTGRPTVSGTPQVGATLSAKPGSWSLPGATYRYQWRAAGVDIPGATGASLVLQQAQAGKAVSVRVSAVTSGYPTVSALSAATDPVASTGLANTALPSITGPARVGGTLTADPGTWSPSGTALTYEWRSGGVPLPGRTGPTLTLSPDLLGRRVLVRVVGTKAGYDAVSARSLRTDVVEPGRITLATPTITGTPRPGETLRVVTGATTPQDSVLSFEWLRDGLPLAGATSSTYRPTTADLGHRLAARVTAQSDAYDDLTVDSVGTAPVRALPTLTVTATPGHRTLRLTVGATALGVDPLDAVVAVRLDDDTLLRTFPVRSGTGTVTLTNLPAGTHTFRVRLRLSPTLDRQTVYQRATILP
jgi:surface antigen